MDGVFTFTIYIECIDLPVRCGLVGTQWRLCWILAEASGVPPGPFPFVNQSHHSDLVGNFRRSYYSCGLHQYLNLGKGEMKKKTH